MTNTKWVVDASHSSIDFSVKHMMVAKTKGVFNKFDASIEADPADLTSANIEFTIDTASIDTRNNDRDTHLRSADFFDVENKPSITFKSTKIVKTSDDEYDVTGDVTIKGVTRSETFAVTFEGQGKNPWGQEVAGFSGKGTINRSDYDLTYNAALETGGVLIGDKITISLEIEASKEA
ncbi:polyisoprenoid-binding protein [Peribacillus cavernae]|uniref:Polyisoprenoid-binding protein n=1 Tax=Peribacillus cavernae TaxID=1674310 RepID=A0A433HCH6_9BACI|nr:YceI family protein [Peribacillus cavernae]MDQ0219709.1 polyisoprenoid-binding protein YceI [Peribacillus cavernae]RUQ25987.1 polyisoprenoid-binding protein [Peribacillus cavernae]